MNQVAMIGRLTADPELRRTGSGVSVCSYTLAVDRPKVKDTTDFINFVTWRQGADYLCTYGKKGDMVAITGSLIARKWQDKDGNNRTSFEVVTDTVRLLSSKREAQGQTVVAPVTVTPAAVQAQVAYGVTPIPQATQNYGAAADIQAGWEEIAGDDLPF